MDVDDARPWGEFFFEVEVLGLELRSAALLPVLVHSASDRPGVGDRLTSRDAFVGVNIGFFSSVTICMRKLVRMIFSGRLPTSLWMNGQTLGLRSRLELKQSDR